MPVFVRPAARQRKFKFNGRLCWRLLGAAGGSFPRVVSPDPAILPGGTLQQMQNLPLSLAAWHSVAPDGPRCALSSALRWHKQHSTSAVSQHNLPVPHRVCQSSVVPGLSRARGLVLPSSGRVHGPGTSPQPSALETFHTKSGVGWFSLYTCNKQC